MQFQNNVRSQYMILIYIYISGKVPKSRIPESQHKRWTLDLGKVYVRFGPAFPNLIRFASKLECGGFWVVNYEPGGFWVVDYKP